MKSNMSRQRQQDVEGMAAGLFRRNYYLWAGVRRCVHGGGHLLVTPEMCPEYPTVVIDMDLTSWALPLAIHAGGPLLGKPGFHVRIGPINIGWSKL